MKSLKKLLGLGKRTRNESGLTRIEGCVIAGIIGTLVLVPALYIGLGTIGWRVIRKHVNYEDKYYQALRIADKNGDGNLDTEEAESWLKNMGVTRLPNQKIGEVNPPYGALCDYIESQEED